MPTRLRLPVPVLALLAAGLACGPAVPEPPAADAGSQYEVPVDPATLPARAAAIRVRGAISADLATAGARCQAERGLGPLRGGPNPPRQDVLLSLAVPGGPLVVRFTANPYAGPGPYQAGPFALLALGPYAGPGVPSLVPAGPGASLTIDADERSGSLDIQATDVAGMGRLSLGGAWTC